MNMELGGVKEFVNPLCETVKVWHTVERHPIPKRRRQWTIRRNEKREPSIFRTPQGIYMHPTLYEQLRIATKEHP